MRLAFLAGVLLSTLSGAYADILFGPITNPANGHEYILLNNSTWTDSEAQAEAMGGHLATINDAAEDNWVYSTFSNFGGQPRHLWIGLSSGGSDGSVLSNYHWADGEALSYSNFGIFEPNFPDEYFVFIIGPADLYFGGQWNNWYDIATAEYGGGGPLLPVNGVVEIVPEPSTWLLVALSLVVCASSKSKRASRLP